MNVSTPRRWQGFWLAQALGLGFLLLSFVRIAGDSQTLGFNDAVLDVLFAGPIWGSRLSYNLLWFGLAMLLVHLIYGAACWLMGVISGIAWGSHRATRRQYVIIWFLLFSAGLLTSNAANYVRSSLGEPYADIMTREVAGIALGNLLGVIVIVLAVGTIAIAFTRWWKAGNRPAQRSWITASVVALACAGLSAHSIVPRPTAVDSAAPNVILIGLDSLRADLLDPQLSPGVTPNIDAFAKQGMVFSNAITPLARTFPSMMSMLTGKHPHHTGAVMNLLPRELIDDSESLPRQLAKAGYHTAYATDEVRFSNIDASYGFDQVITPPIGASEFLIGRIADTPLSNLLVNTRIAGWLFPFVHANRGVSESYDPDTFVDRIDRELQSRQPLFLTVHLTLGHWPYTWAGAPIKKLEPAARWPTYYLQAIKRVDQQFADVLRVVEERGLLRNAVVVVYSDHGESFQSPHEALVPDEDPLVMSLHLKPTWGHGSTVLTAHQYRIALGMRRYGANQPAWSTGHNAAPASFEDVTPTLLDALGLQTNTKFDGRSLLPLLENRVGAATPFIGRIRYTETEYAPQQLATQEGSVSASRLGEAISMYHVDRDTDRVQVKKNRLPRLLLDRQYAAMDDRFLVGAFPSTDHPGYDYMAISLAGGAPQQLFGEPTDPELQVLWRALYAEFGDLLRTRQQDVATGAVANRQREITQNVKK